MTSISFWPWIVRGDLVDAVGVPVRRKIDICNARLKFTVGDCHRISHDRLRKAPMSTSPVRAQTAEAWRMLPASGERPARPSARGGEGRASAA